MDKLRNGILALASVLSLFSQTGFAQSDKAAKIDKFITPFARTNQFSGVVLASENGKVIYEKAFGLANADYKIPNQLNTRIGIASITKYMTSVILSRLVESNKIALADKLNKHIPDFPNGDKITIEMLARHRSGIPHRLARRRRHEVHSARPRQRQGRRRVGVATGLRRKDQPGRSDAR